HPLAWPPLVNPGVSRISGCSEPEHTVPYARAWRSAGPSGTNVRPFRPTSNAASGPEMAVDGTELDFETDPSRRSDRDAWSDKGIRSAAQTAPAHGDPPAIRRLVPDPGPC